MSRDSLIPKASRRPTEVTPPARLSHLQVDPRGYPIISVIPQQPGDVDFGVLSEKRKLVVATYDLCAVCALPFRDELRWQVIFGEEIQKVDSSVAVPEAPVHEICALYAAQVCPYVSSPYARLGDPYRKGQRRPETLTLAGFASTASVFGYASDVQKGENVLVYEMADLRRTHTLVSADDAREVYETALRTETAIELDDQERRIVDLLCNPLPENNEDSGTAMAGAALIIGAAFCPDIRQVQGMKMFTESHNSHYFPFATNLLFKPELMAAADFEDDSFAAAVSWFQTRENLPAVLEKWRLDAARTLRDPQGRRPPIARRQAPVVRDDEAIRKRHEAEARLRKQRKKGKGPSQS
ncbi:hypothetical protein [Salininema proteolyticum]|uniref:Uncharacterized protein n=1 Tax=Salininema proteolyticum TaxID=1607685 RepID=A0ABV8U4F9_9ACTN